MPAQTHVAMAHAVEICGAKPVFVDAEPRTGAVDRAPRSRGMDPLLTGNGKPYVLMRYGGGPLSLHHG